MDILEMPREHWAAILRRRAYDYIVNCIGILKPAVKEQDAKTLCRAIRVNALFPHELAAMASDSCILHVSTDGVFSGTLGRPYVETDPTDCPDAYGKTKALGECPAANVINIRCSLIGRDPAGGKGLIEWVLRSPDGAELTGFDDQHWNGVTTRQFAQLCRRIIESGSFDQVRHESGLHHFCPNPNTTKYELLCRIRETAGRNIVIRRGRSGAARARILGSIYSSLRGMYADSPSWDTVIRDALAGE
jgi:dTDP-4-dehydrorhamnose reductase